LLAAAWASRRRRRPLAAASLLLAFVLSPAGTAGAQTLPPYLRCDVSLGVPTTRGTIGDFDRNGTPDLAVLTSGNNALVMLSDRTLFAQGSCPEALTVSSISGGTQPIAITAADFRQMGRLDLAIASRDGVTVLDNDGSGGFSGSGPLPTPPPPTPGISGASDIAAANLNRDLFPDLVVGNRQGNRVTILYNQGDGSFQVAHSLEVGEPVSRVAAADLNADGRLDVVALSDIGNASVFLQDAEGGFLEPIGVTVGGAPIDFGVAVTNAVASIFDFDRNDVPDLAFARRDPGEVAPYVGVLSSGETLRYDETSAFDAGGPAALAIADFNGDTTLDVAVSDKSNNLVRFYLGDGEGGLSPSQVLQTAADPAGLLVADFDGDGRLDVASLSDTNVMSFFLSSNPPPTVTSTPTATGTDTPSPQPSDTVTPTVTSTPTPTETPTPTSTRTPTPSTTLTPTNTWTPTETPLVFIGLQGSGCAAGAGEGSTVLWLAGVALWWAARRRP
jgi:hypothetical protein